MKKVNLAVVVLCLTLGFGVAVAFAQGHVTLSLAEQGMSQRFPVEFDHAIHLAKMGDDSCKDCHHGRHGDQVNYQPGDEEKRCSDCHKAADEGGMPGVMHAFHKNCEGCHARERAGHKQSGPVACGECHVRK